MKIILCLLLLSTSGCYSTIERFDSTHPDVNVRNLTPQEVMEKHFTPEACEALRDIPVVISDLQMGPGFAAGTNFWSKLAGLFIGIGIDRKVSMSHDRAHDSEMERMLVHEYIHHLHDMQLDGDSIWIDEDEFVEAYKKCATDTRYAGIVHLTESLANRWVTNTFGISDAAEYIAYVGDICATRNSPEYLGRVFRKILKRFDY